ncbi:hypothetical protein [Ruminiclostridium josui]|nr:hypothetical protein [Ruminiclostridium josui]
MCSDLFKVLTSIHNKLLEECREQFIEDNDHHEQVYQVMNRMDLISKF